jgi:nicotinate-nucleotide adenylyltransferase
MKPNTDPEKTESAIALYGGSFDPVHRAHLEVARAVLNELSLQKVIFIPAAQSPLKANAAQADDASRLEMLRLAIGGDHRFAVDDCEIRRGGTSFTIETVRAYRAAHPGSTLYWIIGADQFQCLSRWHAIDELVRLISFIVLRRPGYATCAPEIPGLRFREVDAPLMEHSSSAIRQRIAEGPPSGSSGSLGDWLPRSVEAFIYEHGLYTSRPS